MNSITVGMQRLVTLEKVVDSGVRNMMDAADALKEIRDDKLYVERGYDSFDSYLSDEWGFGRNYINKIIRSAETRKRLGTVVPEIDSGSLSEKALRELNSVSDDKLEDVIELAKSDGNSLTAKSIKDARESVLGSKPKYTPIDVSQDKLDQSYRLGLQALYSLRRHLGNLGMLDTYDKTLQKIKKDLGE